MARNDSRARADDDLNAIRDASALEVAPSDRSVLLVQFQSRQSAPVGQATCDRDRSIARERPDLQRVTRPTNRARIVSSAASSGVVAISARGISAVSSARRSRTASCRAWRAR
jgi:hypothetical protein